MNLIATYVRYLLDLEGAHSRTPIRTRRCKCFAGAVTNSNPMHWQAARASWHQHGCRYQDEQVHAAKQTTAVYCDAADAGAIAAGEAKGVVMPAASGACTGAGAGMAGAVGVVLAGSGAGITGVVGVTAGALMTVDAATGTNGAACTLPP